MITVVKLYLLQNVFIRRSLFLGYDRSGKVCRFIPLITGSRNPVHTSNCPKSRLYHDYHPIDSNSIQPDGASEIMSEKYIVERNQLKLKDIRPDNTPMRLYDRWILSLAHVAAQSSWRHC